jgi:hypothetical protein
MTHMLLTYVSPGGHKTTLDFLLHSKEPDNKNCLILGISLSKKVQILHC